MKLLLKGEGKTKANILKAKQNNLCKLCKCEFTSNNDWEFHFKQRWTHGGSAQMNNLTVVHPECHELLHAKTDNKLGPLAGLTEGLEPYEGKLLRAVLRGRSLVTT
jgi:hypothetical protein